MKFEIKKWDDLFEIKLSGPLDSSEFENLFVALFLQDEWATDSRILYDLSALDVGKLDPGEMIDIIDLCEIWRSEIGRGRCVFVVPQKEQYLFARIFIRRTTFKWKVEMETFDARFEAIQWVLDN
jgi:hypothetical protein